MKIIYTTDLHGNRDKYRQLEEVSHDFGADVVINGGDVLPHGGSDIQVGFIIDQLAPHFEYFDQEGIDYLIQLGNDDMSCLDGFFRNQCWSYDHVYDTVAEPARIDNFDFIGMNLVRDYPFRLKDRCRLDGLDSNEELPNQYGSALVSIKSAEQYVEIEDWEGCIHSKCSIAEELCQLPQPRSDCELVYIFHQPPANMGLDVCYDGRQVGSDAVREFLRSSDAKYSLHGHIHESKKMTEVWKANLGNTQCIQPGQLEAFTYVTIDTDSGISEHFEI